MAKLNLLQNNSLTDSTNKRLKKLANKLILYKLKVYFNMRLKLKLL